MSVLHSFSCSTLLQAVEGAVYALLLLVFVLPLRCRWWWKTAIAAVLFPITQKFNLYSWCGLNPYNPDLSMRLVAFHGWLYTAAMLLFGEMLLVRCLQLACRILRRRLPPVASSPRLAVPTAAALGAYAMWEGLRIPDVTRRTLELPGLPPAFDGFRIVQLSDLHVNTATTVDKFRAIVDKVNACAPDLVCITGDFVDAAPARIADQLAPLARLRAPHGVMACTGNHDFYFRYRQWKPVFGKLGLVMLDNAHRVIRRGGAALAVGGVLDESGIRTMASRGEAGWWPEPDPEKAFAGAPPGAYRILLQHRPVNTAAAARAGVKLMLSGHTHGGIAWGMDLLVAKWNDGHIRGLYRENGLALYVHSGTCQWAGFPLRFGVPGEIAELVLRCK